MGDEPENIPAISKLVVSGSTHALRANAANTSMIENWKYLIVYMY